MRRMLLAAAGLALLIPAALAETAPPPAAPMPPAPAGQPGGPGPTAGLRGPQGGPMGGPDMPPLPPGGPEGRRGHGGPGLMPPPPPRGAHVRLERGDARIDVQCAEDDSTKACAEIVGGLLDKLAALPASPRN